MMAADRASLIVDLMEAAVRTEGVGQLNIGKLLRATAIALVRREAADRGFPDVPQRLADDLATLSGRLGSTADANNGPDTHRVGSVQSAIDSPMSQYLSLGAAIIREGGWGSSARFPDPYVCRRCGTMFDRPPAGNCPSCGAHGLTFERFGPVYWASRYQPHEVVDRLAANPSLFVDAIGRLPPDRLRWTPAGTSWSAVDVLRHVLAADALLSERVTRLLDEDDPSLVSRSTTGRTGPAPHDTRSMVKSWIETRTATVRRLRGASPNDWSRSGRHSVLGRVTLIEQASFFAAHELTHLRQLELLRRALNETA